MQGGPGVNVPQLLASGAVTAFLGEAVDATVICGVVLVNAVVGYIQEAKAAGALDALAKAMVTEAVVVRSGAIRRVAAIVLDVASGRKTGGQQ